MWCINCTHCVCVHLQECPTSTSTCLIQLLFPARVNLKSRERTASQSLNFSFLQHPVKALSMLYIKHIFVLQEKHQMLPTP